MERKNTGILVIIIGLLVIMLPLTFLSVYFKFTTPVKEKEEPITNDVPQKETNDTSKYRDGKLYFYNKDKQLLGEYVCQKDPCSYAISENDDKLYALDYLETEQTDINVLLDKYAFIYDNEQTLLWDIEKNEVVNTYKSVKNYNNMISPEIVLVKNTEDKWGIIKLGEQVETISDFTYDFIGLIDNLDENNLLKTNNYIVKNGNLWGIIDGEGDLISNYLAGEITSYNDILISLKNENIYYLYDYNGKRVVDENGFNYLSFTDKYINIVDKNNNLYIYDYINDKKISPNIKLDNNDYKKAFKSQLNYGTNKIDLTIGDKTYNYDL